MKKPCLFLAVFFAVSFIARVPAGAQEKRGFDLSTFDVPSFSPVLSNYFTDTMANSLSARFDYLDFNLEGDTIKARHEGQRDMSESLFNTAIVLNIRFGKPDALVKFTIPVYYGSLFTLGGPAGGMNIQTNDSFYGSGLHIKSDYVSLYGFVGYGSQSRFDANAYNSAYQEVTDAWEQSGQSYEPVYPSRNDYYEKSGAVLWSVMPEIHINKIPVLGSAFSLLKGYLTMDSSLDGFKPSYKTQLLFREIHLGQSVMSLAAVTGSAWYNAESKSTVYGGRFGIQMGMGNDIQYLVIAEGGYRSFFDVVSADPSYYRDGPYGRLFLGVSVLVRSLRSYGSLCLTVESSPQNWPLPRFGFFMGLSGSMKMKFYLNMYDDARAKGAKMTATLEDGLYEIIGRHFF